MPGNIKNQAYLAGQECLGHPVCNHNFDDKVFLVVYQIAVAMTNDIIKRQNKTNKCIL